MFFKLIFSVTLLSFSLVPPLVFEAFERSLGVTDPLLNILDMLLLLLEKVATLVEVAITKDLTVFYPGCCAKTMTHWSMRVML